MQNVLITGAGGFVGSYIIPVLSPFYKVIAGFRNVARAPGDPNLAYEALNFTDAASVERVMNKHEPDVVIHAGAMSKPDDCELDREGAFRTNVTGTIHLLKEAKKHKSFFLFLSTDFVFDGEKGMYTEDDPTGTPVNYYGITKLLAEDEVRAYTYAWSIVRTVLVYGKPLEGRHNILTLVKEKLERGEMYNVFHDQVRTPTYVEDLAGAIKRIIDLKKEGVFHIAGQDVLTPYDMAVEVAQYFATDKNLLKKADRESFAQPALRPLKTGFNITKAKTELGYKPTSFTEGLKKTFV